MKIGKFVVLTERAYLYIHSVLIWPISKPIGSREKKPFFSLCPIKKITGFQEKKAEFMKPNWGKPLENYSATNNLLFSLALSFDWLPF